MFSLVSFTPAQASFDFASQSSGVIKILAFEDDTAGDFTLISQATGFFISDEVAVTAAHAVLSQGGDELSEAIPYLIVERENPNNANDPLKSLARVIALDNKNDLALVHVIPLAFDTTANRRISLEHHSFAIASEEPSIGNRINIIGYPDIANTELALTTGVISTQEQNGGVTVFTSDTVVSNGNSGGPAINENGEVFGVVSQVEFSGSNNAQLSRIVSLNDVSEWVSQQKVNLSNYQYSKSFYDRCQDAASLRVSASSEERTVTIASRYYPDFYLVLPANHRIDAPYPDGGFYVYNEDNETVMTIGLTPTPVPLTQNVLQSNLREIYHANIDDSTVSEFTLSDAKGIKFHVKDSSATFYGLVKSNWLALVILPKQNNLLSSLKILGTPTPQASFSIYEDKLQGVRITAPAGYYIHDSDEYSLEIYHPNGLEESIYTLDFVDKPFDEFVGDGLDELEKDPDLEVQVSKFGHTPSGNRTAVFKALSHSLLIFSSSAIEDPTRNRTLYIRGLTSDRFDDLSENDFLLNNITFGHNFTESMVNLLDLLKASGDTNDLPPRLRSGDVSDTTTSQPESPAAPDQSQSIDGDLARDNLLGYILLQVEEHGEAWYIEPSSRERIYMRDGKVAFEVMRKYGLGITNGDLNKIQIGTKPTDSNVCNSFSRALAGRVLLQVEENGEAWYIYPKNCRRYSLGRPDDAYEIMRFLGLGALNTDVHAIRERAL